MRMSIATKTLKKKDRRFKAPADKHIRRQVSLHPLIIKRSDILMQLRATSDFSQFLALLINEDYDRRINKP